MGRQSVVAIWLRGNVEQYRVALNQLPRGPQACGEEALVVLGRGNPEFPGIARKCAADLGDATRVLAWFGRFHGLLLGEVRAAERGLHSLPRMTAATRAGVVQEVDAWAPRVSGATHSTR
jgi:hypothetical protein